MATDIKKISAISISSPQPPEQTVQFDPIYELVEKATPEEVEVENHLLAQTWDLLVKSNAPNRAYHLIINVSPSSPGGATLTDNGRCDASFSRSKIFEVGQTLRAKNIDQLAFLQSHELAHCELGHKPETDLAKMRARELEADQLALVYMKKAGFDPEKGKQWLKQVAIADREDAAFFGTKLLPESESTHPYAENRLRALEKKKK